MNRETIKNILNDNPEMKDKLFARGFYFTDSYVDDSKYPFWGLWSKEELGNYTLLVAPKQRHKVVKDVNCTLILVGHAYNPFQMKSDETDILVSLQKKMEENEDAFFNELNELTGVFTLIWVKKGNVYVVGDATGMQNTFYTNVNGKVFVASHTNLLGDLLNLEWDPYIKRLSKYRFFGLLGNSLPGDLTQFNEVKRMVPNHYICFDENKTINVKRFFWPRVQGKSNMEITKEVSEILHANMQLIAEKWKKPAVSMTGGCDSKTTLACVKGLYDKFAYFSYTSSESEDVDANAAHKICEALGLKHTIYRIPQQDSEQTLIEETRDILLWNTGNLTPINRNDVRKRRFFADTEDFDVEIKSWASEIGRAYYSKRFNGRKKFGKTPTARVCTTLYKFFLHDRKLVKDTDHMFTEYLGKYFEQAKMNPIEWQEQFFWEFRVPSWNGLVITGEHRYSFDITIPYNNRILLELLVSAPIEDRINDTIYSEIRKYMNPVIDETGIAVTNLKHTKNREKAENLYYILHSHSWI